MNIIANTQEGFLITATTEEVQAILQSVAGRVIPKDSITIGNKIPAIDYAATIRDIREIKSSYEFTKLLLNAKDFNKKLEALNIAVESVHKL